MIQKSSVGFHTATKKSMRKLRFLVERHLLMLVLPWGEDILNYKICIPFCSIFCGYTPRIIHVEPMKNLSLMIRGFVVYCLIVNFQTTKEDVMVGVKVGKDESIDRALRRFKKKVDAIGILNDYKERQEYLQPSEARRLKKRKAINRQRWKDTQERDHTI